MIPKSSFHSCCKVSRVANEGNVHRSLATTPVGLLDANRSTSTRLIEDSTSIEHQTQPISHETKSEQQQKNEEQKQRSERE
uniref:Uncharacterized protein n=1 Tax=Tetranychus urticae TaxID=32264 RepID=T1JS95_TETUR